MYGLCLAAARLAYPFCGAARGGGKRRVEPYGVKYGDKSFYNRGFTGSGASRQHHDPVFKGGSYGKTLQLCVLKTVFVFRFRYKGTDILARYLRAGSVYLAQLVRTVYFCAAVACEGIIQSTVVLKRNDPAFLFKRFYVLGQNISCDSQYFGRGVLKFCLGQTGVSAGLRRGLQCVDNARAQTFL